MTPLERAFLIVGILGAVAFALVAADVSFHGQLEQRDQPIADWLAAHANGVPWFSRGFDFLGSVFVVAPLILVSAIVLWRRQERREAARIIILGLVGLAAYSAFKQFFARARPSTAIGLESGYSFPSGHATMAAVLACYFLWLALRQPRGRVAAIPLVAAAAAWALLMALSRITYGVHYFTDVLGGLALGASVGALGIGLPALLRPADR